MVAVTIDDLPSVRLRWDADGLDEMTSKILYHCKNHDIPAIGFVVESKLYIDGELDDGRVALLELWLNAGFELGNHTYSHPDLHRTPLDRFKDNVIRGEVVTRPLLATYNTTPRYFRHPMLHTGRDLETKHELERFLGERGYKVAPVTVDNSEWIFAFAYYKAREDGDGELMRRLAVAYLAYMEEMFEYCEQQSVALFDREIPQVLLVHANWLNADHFGALATMIERRGYRFVSLDEVLGDEAYVSPDTYTGPAGITWIHRWAITAGKGREFFGEEPATPQWVLDAAGLESE
jgi:peptidoglycan/xylan/chitin deacetylase (PgdA/CDA1 family)